MPSLRMLRGPEPGRIYELTEDSITIGRGRRNEIIIHDNEVSREHCRLVKVLFDYEIYDLQSTNGTFLNGRPVTEATTPMFDTNILELGDSIVLEYVASHEAINTPSPDMHTQPQTMPVVVDPSRNAEYYLVIRRRSQSLPEVFLLDSPLVDIGRHLDNTICLVENQVSRFHMRLNRLDNQYMIEDLGSVNGTYVNGRQVEKPMPLEAGDFIAIGAMVEMWFTDDLESLRMIPYTPEEAAAASRKTEEHRESAEPAAENGENGNTRATAEVRSVSAADDEAPPLSGLLQNYTLTIAAAPVLIPPPPSNGLPIVAVAVTDRTASETVPNPRDFSADTQQTSQTSVKSALMAEREAHAISDPIRDPREASNKDA